MDELIRKSDAIDAVNGLYIHELSDGEYLVDADTEDTLIGKFQTIDALADLPPAQQWISCSKRLPEKDFKDVLAYDGADMFVAWVNNGYWYSFDSNFDIHTPILAWTPLPDAPAIKE